MRRPELAAVLFLLTGFAPVTVSAQQPTPDASQPQAQNAPVRPERTPQAPDQARTENAPVQPERTPQQSDQSRERERQSAEDTRINRDWTTRQRGEDRMDMDRMRQRQMGRMMDQDEDHRTIGRNWRRDDDDMDHRGSRYGSMDRSEGGYYYERRARPRVKICFEYEDGDEFCRYKD